jgi:hypothetical protein
MYARVRLVTKIIGEPKPLSQAEVTELFRIRDQQGWGRKKPGLEDVDPALIDVIAQVVIEVMKKR